MSAPRCGFDGNPDIYGLGIRLGIYFQWLSALLIYQFYPAGRDELAFTYTSFIVAVAIATLVLTADAHSTYTAEVFILMYIVFGGVFTVMVTAISSNRYASQRIHSRRPFTTWALYLSIYNLLLAVTAIYCAWFWLRGIHHDFEKTPCGTYGMLLAKARLYRPAVYKFLGAVSTIAATFFGLSFFTLGIIVAEHGVHNRVVVDIAPPVTNVTAFLWSIIGIELTLHWNRITGVYSLKSTGQLIPFIIGLAGLCRVVIGALRGADLAKTGSMECIAQRKAVNAEARLEISMEKSVWSDAPICWS